MRRFAGTVLMLACVLVQVTWAPRLQVFGVFPNLVLLAVIGLTWTNGVHAGLIWACVGGVLLDMTAPGPLGPHALALLAGAYVTGFWARNLARERPLHPALAAAASTVIYSGILLAADQLLALTMPPPRLVLQLTIAAAVYNGVLMPFALAAMRRVQPLTRGVVTPA
jgi:rod shape-determining protein MreD